MADRDHSVVSTWMKPPHKEEGGENRCPFDWKREKGVQGVRDCQARGEDEMQWSTKTHHLSEAPEQIVEHGWGEKDMLILSA